MLPMPTASGERSTITLSWRYQLFVTVCVHFLCPVTAMERVPAAATQVRLNHSLAVARILLLSHFSWFWLTACGHLSNYII